MPTQAKDAEKTMDVAIIGAGIAGLAVSLRLASAGLSVEVFERAAKVGGKIRTIATDIGPVDAGPTVLTLRPVFEDLFSSAGARLCDHVELIRQDCLARHFWPDGQSLDLFDDLDRNMAAITAAFGAKSAQDYLAFHQRTTVLFDSFREPMMYAAQPSQMGINMQVISRPRLIAAMAPHLSLAQSLARQFREPRLAQLFGRYATYVGGSPFQSPAILSLIWQAEAAGVWQAKGGMQSLVQAIKALAERNGATFHTNAEVAQIDVTNGQARGITLKDGPKIKASFVVFNGDPAALGKGLLGKDVRKAVAPVSPLKRSNSAHVWSFAAKATHLKLGLHNVFFGRDKAAEFDDLKRGVIPRDPTLYVYAQDRGGSAAPKGPERFEIIMNAPATDMQTTSPQEIAQCHELTFLTLAAMGLTFSPTPKQTLTTPAMFNHLFPGSGGALYGQSPHGLTAAFKRPTAHSRIRGLYLAGGGCHPGAGIPMATLSGKHAAEAILSDQTSTLMSHKTGTRGGMSMGSATMAAARSRSSAS